MRTRPPGTMQPGHLCQQGKFTVQLWGTRVLCWGCVRDSTRVLCWGCVRGSTRVLCVRDGAEVLHWGHVRVVSGRGATLGVCQGQYQGAMLEACWGHVRGYNKHLYR